MITFSQVTKQFSNDAYALKDVSFEVAAGELILVTGPSGSGKTTLMRLLTREYLPTSGDIEFEGQSLQKIKSSQVHHHRRKIGVVFQDYKLLPELNVWENIALALNIINKPQSEVEERVTDLLNLIQLSDKAFLFPSQLSGGEAQRVSIARALASAPMVVFADEPTGNLDPETSAMIARLLQKINELGTTILFATHDQTVLDTLSHHRIIRLEKGALVKDSGKQKSSTKDTAPSETTTNLEVKSDTTPEEEPPAESESSEKQTSSDKEPEAKKPKKKDKKQRVSLKKLWPFGGSSKPKKSPPPEETEDMQDFVEISIEDIEKKED